MKPIENKYRTNRGCEVVERKSETAAGAERVDIVLSAEKTEQERR